MTDPVYKERGLTFDDFNPGDAFATARRTITESDVASFAGISGDFNPLHTDEETMKDSPFKGRIAHGMLIASVATGLANQLGIFEGTTIALLEMTFKFTGAVRFGDTVRLVLTVASKKESSKPDRGVVTFGAAVKNQRGETVVDSQWVVLLKRRGPK